LDSYDICYKKTKKLSLDYSESDTIAYNYNDNPIVQTTKSVFAETDRSRQGTVSLHRLLNNTTLPPTIFSLFFRRFATHLQEGILNKNY